MNLIPKFSYHTEEVHKCLQKPTARDKNVRRIKRNFKLKHYNEIFFSQSERDPRTDQRTDKSSYRVACPVSSQAKVGWKG